MSKNGINEEFKITQDNISQVRSTAENKQRNAKDINAEDAFYNDVNQHSERIQQLVQQIEEFPDPAVRSLLAQCMEAVLTLHGRGLERIFDLIGKMEGDTDTIKQNLIHDDFIKGMLLIHGLHPDDLETRLYRALEKVKPYMDSHGGSVQVLSLKDGVATLKLEGSCDGCPSSASTLELGIKEAIEEECPDLLGLEVKGLADNPLAREILKNNEKGRTASSAQKSKTGYAIINGVSNLSDGEKVSIKIEDTSLIICRVDGNLYAYENECPGCGMALDSGKLEDGKLKCKLGHDFDVQQAGKCPDDPNIHLNPFPLIKENGQIKVAVG